MPEIKAMMVKTVGEAKDIWMKHFIIDTYFLDEYLVMFYVD